MLRQGSGHSLDGVIDVVEAGVDDGFAQPGEPLDVERDVVVDEEDGLGAMPACIGNVGEHACDWIRVEVAAAHLDDRTEAAVEGTAAGCFDDVGAAPEQRVAAKYAGIAIRQPQAFRRQRDGRRRPVVDEMACLSERKAWNIRQALRAGLRIGRRAAALDRANERAERPLAFAADEEIDVGRFVGLGRETRIVSAGHADRSNGFRIVEAVGEALQRSLGRPSDSRPSRSKSGGLRPWR